MKFFYLIVAFLSVMLAGSLCKAQSQGANQNAPNQKIVAAGKEYGTSSFHQWLWGKNYRKEWATPVRLPVVMLDTLQGGMKPVKAGGGNQTKSLQVEDSQGRKYTLRTVNKTLGKVLPKEFLGSFVEKIVDDKVSMSNPYAAPVAAYLAENAGVYHTYPRFIYLPKQAAIDTFPNFGNAVYLFEQKLDGNWETAANLGNFKDFTGTYKIIDSILSDNRFGVDQKTFVRSRLFDMLINDWDRHEDQWEWGGKKEKGRIIFSPLPQDRDQAFFKYDGVILTTLLKASGMKYFQPFKEEMVDVTTFNYEQRNLDRFFANEMTLSDWQTIAQSMQQALTDKVVEDAVSKFLPEVKNISGNVIVKKLKGRRQRLVEYATEYYRFIAKEVDIPGSKRNEQFVVNRTADAIEVKVFALEENGNSEPLYKRNFSPKETKEIRLYGISGNDRFIVTGEENETKIRLIGSDEKDSMTINGSNVHVYDNRKNVINAADGVKLHLSAKKKITDFEYAAFKYNKAGLGPVVFYNNDDFFYVGLGYSILTQKWRREPFASKHTFGVNYSISQKALSLTYDGTIPKAVGKWDLAVKGVWDAIRWTNFWGLGNDTKFDEQKIYFYRARSEQWLGSVGLIRKFGRLNLKVDGFFQSVRVINDADRFTGKNLAPFMPDLTKVRRFGGAELLYNLHRVNDSIVPTKGYVFWGRAAYTQNLKNASRSVGDFQANLRLYVPLSSKFSLVVSGGAETVTGNPEFYQYAFIGGGQTFRGLRLSRFWGKSAYYNNNELRYMTNVKSRAYNGKIGLLTFFDDGRVWMPNENSGTLHTSYGAGLIIAPFYKIYGELTYGISDDEKLVQLRLVLPIRSFK